MVAYSLTEEAFLTILLHSAKYPSRTICGVLLGSDPSRQSKSISITKAVPLFHLSMLLGPCVETALSQVEVYAQQNKLALLGYYHAEARLDAIDMHPIGRRIADKLAQRQPETCVLLLDSRRLLSFSKEGNTAAPADLMLQEASGAQTTWKRVPENSQGASLSLAGDSSWEQVRTRFLNLHQAGLHTKLADFDEHLDDVSRDYLNSDLFDAATSAIKR